MRTQYLRTYEATFPLSDDAHSVGNRRSPKEGGGEAEGPGRGRGPGAGQPSFAANWSGSRFRAQRIAGTVPIENAEETSALRSTMT